MRAAFLPLALALPLSACDPKPDSADDPTRPDAAPGLTLDAPGDGEAFGPGEAVTVAGRVSDDVDLPDTLSLVVTSNVDGEVARPLIVADGTFSEAVALTPGGHVLTVVAGDSAGNAATARVSVTVEAPIVNDPPTVPAVHIEPGTAITGGWLSVALDTPSVDPEGGPVTYRYAWTVTEAGVTTEVSTDATVDGALTFRGQVWDVEVWASDGVNEVGPATGTATIVNAPPYGGEVKLDPEEPVLTDTVTCTISGVSDAEADALVYTYEWYVSGALAGDGTETLASGAFVYGDELQCVVYVSDGTDTVAFSSDVVEVGNLAPSAPTVEITPSTPADTDDLVCAVTAESVDPEGSAVTYTYDWEVDGASTSYTTDTIPAADTTRDEVWTCTVTATDADGGDTSASASVTVGLAWEDDVSASDAWVTIDGAEADGAFGKTVALLGDTDGDGLSEVAVGANGENAQDGAVYLFAGASLAGALTTADAAASWTGAYNDGQLGGFRALAAPGDLDGDGAAELLFAAPDADANGNGSGEAYLVYGGGTLALGAAPSDADWRVTATVSDQVGARMAGGDFDGDGFTDLLVAAPGSSENGRTTGLVGLFYGDGARLAGDASVLDADWYVMGDAEGDGLGWTTRGVGDVDGDGVDDFVVGALYADPGGSESGALGLLLGGARRAGDDALADVNTARFSGDAASDRFGYDAVGGVDLDADGVGDLLVAAYQDDAGATDAGAVHVYLGGSSWAAELTPADADASFLGSTTTARFGHVMTSPGDLDGDGTSDLLIGALFDSPTGLANQGAAYLLLSPDWAGIGVDTDISWRAGGEAAQDLFGDALSAGRGDVDGDGREDFAVGAQGYDGAASAAGRVYVWRGR